jgi:serine/threonine protein kinase
LAINYGCGLTRGYGCFPGRNREPLEWSARQKIAVGAARGLRYLHEECRVGCIVHRDMRPNNILITHDFEPLVYQPFSLIFVVEELEFGSTSSSYLNVAPLLSAILSNYLCFSKIPLGIFLWTNNTGLSKCP